MKVLTVLALASLLACAHCAAIAVPRHHHHSPKGMAAFDLGGYDVGGGGEDEEQAKMVLPRRFRPKLPKFPHIHDDEDEEDEGYAAYNGPRNNKIGRAAAAAASSPSSGLLHARGHLPTPTAGTSYGSRLERDGFEARERTVVDLESQP